MEFLARFGEYLVRRAPELLEQGASHLLAVAVAVGLATVIGVALGIATYRTESPRQGVLAVTSTFLTIPSFALFGLALVFLPFSLFWRSVAVLSIYGLLPIVRNTVTGLRGVDQAVVESAKGMGLNPAQQLLRVELPLAWPVIITGIRVSTQITMGIAAIAAVINGPGFGNSILAGLARIGGAGALDSTVAGTLGVIVLALLADAIFQVIDRLTTSKGIQ